MRVQLGKMTKIKTGKLDANASSVDGVYPFFTCAKEPLKISSFSYDCECVLVAGNGDLNVKYYNGKFDAYQRTYIIEDNSNGELYIPYLYYLMEGYIEQLRGQAIGGIIKYIKLRNLTDVLIEMPNNEIQKRVVEILDKEQQIIKARKKQLEELDNLIKARFVEMFGSYPANEKGWNEGIIRDIVDEVGYGSSRPSTGGGRYPYLRMNNITYSGKLDLTNIKQIDVPENELPRCTVQRGDVLFNRTNSKELVGKTCVYDREEMMVLAGFVVRVRVNAKLARPEFLSIFMNMEFTKKKLYAMCKVASGQANINAQELQDIGIYIPPIDIQNQFADFVHQVDKSKVVL